MFTAFRSFLALVHAGQRSISAETNAQKARNSRVEGRFAENPSTVIASKPLLTSSAQLDLEVFAEPHERHLNAVVTNIQFL